MSGPVNAGRERTGQIGVLPVHLRPPPFPEWGPLDVRTRYRDAMADQRFLHQFLSAGPGVDLVVTTPSGDVLRLPLSDVLAHATMASTDVLNPDAPAELLRWAWDDIPLCDDHDTEYDNCPAGPPVRRAARLIVEEIPLVVPVRRQLEDGSWGTVEITPEEWARTEGRVTRGQ